MDVCVYVDRCHSSMNFSNIIIFYVGLNDDDGDDHAWTMTKTCQTF